MDDSDVLSLPTRSSGIWYVEQAVHVVTICWIDHETIYSACMSTAQGRRQQRRPNNNLRPKEPNICQLRGRAGRVSKQCTASERVKRLMVDCFFLSCCERSLRPTGLDVGCPRGALTRIVVVLVVGGVVHARYPCI